MKTMIILFVLAWQGAAGLLFAQKLTLEVRGFEAIKGRLNVAFYHSQETFMKEPLATFRVDVVAPTLSIPCKGLPAGAYAVALFRMRTGTISWTPLPLALLRRNMVSAMMPEG